MQTHKDDLRSSCYCKRFLVYLYSHFFISDRKKIVPFLSLFIAVVLIFGMTVVIHHGDPDVNWLSNRLTLDYSFADEPIIKRAQFIKHLPFLWKSATDEQNKFVSYCSYEADRRGLNQNIIAFSLYGNFSDERHFTRYADPIKIILSNISQVYPGWIMRVYSAMEPDNQLGNLRIKELFDEYPFVDLCNVTRVLEVRNITRPLHPGTWRFLPLMDATVDRLLSRDSDSLVTARAADAVLQWFRESNATFHMMRDHWGHCSTLILAGMWGAKIYQNRQAILSASSKLFYESDHKMEYGFDQTLLNTFIWPLAINDSLVHDSYCCLRFTGTTAFPTQRQGTEYVGKVVHQELVGHPPPDKCPEKCRPPQHPEWINC